MRLLFHLVLVRAAIGFTIIDTVCEPSRIFTARSDGYALDIGCGTGESTIDMFMTHPGMTLVGIDKSEDMIRHAKNRYGGVNPIFLCCDAAAPVFAPRVFDVVQMRFCLFSIRDENVIHEAWRVLRHDGRLVVIDYDPVHPYAREVLACAPQAWDRMAGGDPYRYLGLLERRFEPLETHFRDGVFSRVYRKKKAS
jgi:ubiquinone/menaquinone biosynthesis C-methylase UbiE